MKRNLANFNSKQTTCIVKGEAQKSPLFWRFSGGFWFSQDRLFSKNSTRKPLNLIKSPIFTNAPCKTACLYNVPSMHILDLNLAMVHLGWNLANFGEWATLISLWDVEVPLFLHMLLCVMMCHDGILHVWVCTLQDGYSDCGQPLALQALCLCF